ncbi:Glycerol 2-dehydrogenase (NADP(+)) [Seminavis robusta]|uniref:Glycerol 2-dehydrogenase (NADP(+)) n=1 Tax=Seminavis robusta TaxID=568900 RepID=A0A9N8EA73_9STRA|nr:Glycerol 2-dehydrogenase (NADP(+)) [Seminavis robusta]|eukprot:Sro678_g185990.1 Glycerol 2-dehydrogenase (NADP(+)) (342) ;mRNA; r:43341-44629
MSRRDAVLKSSAAALASASWFLPTTGSSAATTDKNSIPTWTLRGGVKMPVLALNTVGLSAEDTTRAVGFALKEGITHVDFHPGKERDGVAQYLAEHSAARSELFLNTKIRKPPPGTSPEDAAERARTQIAEDLTALGLSSVDMLMLRDSPDAAVLQAQWAVMEEALANGQTRSVGVINYCPFSLNAILETARVKPALNYHLLHVGMGTDPRGLVRFCNSRGIRTFAYGAVGEPGPNDELLNSSTLRRIAENHHVSPEAAALRWVLQTGAACSVRPTLNFGLGTSQCTEENGCDAGLQARAASFSWKLSAKEMAELSALKSPNDNPTLFSSAGCPDAFVMPK